MDYHPFKNAINGYLTRYAGTDRPAFWDIDKLCPELRALEQAWPAIAAEVDELLKERVDMPQYHEVNAPAAEISSNTRGRWNVFMLDLLGHRAKQNRARCPETCRALDNIPKRVQAFVSVLEPRKSIPEHVGPYLGYLRYHLGVRVPKDNPPFIRVNGTPYTWKEGEGVIFDDSLPHAVENPSDQLRAVLIVDIPRPLPLIPNFVNKALLYGLAAPLYGRPVIRRADDYQTA
jgi:aspartate beta-hydroxylase/beta-hydroxylase